MPVLKEIPAIIFGAYNNLRGILSVPNYQLYTPPMEERHGPESSRRNFRCDRRNVGHYELPCAVSRRPRSLQRAEFIAYLDQTAARIETEGENEALLQVFRANIESIRMDRVETTLN
jgi:hypothetical protein